MLREAAVDRPLVIKLVRHGESLANVRAVDPQKEGDYRTPLTDLGRAQARDAGAALGAEFLRGALVYISPYARARQTWDELAKSSGVLPGATLLYEDPRLREQDHGYSDVAAQAPMRERHGWFYYRYEGGESPADVYDRVSGFLESLMRQVERKSAQRVLIVTHGMAIRCFVMRFLHLTVEEFEAIDNPGNGEVVTIAPRGEVERAYVEVGAWAVGGCGRDREGPRGKGAKGQRGKGAKGERQSLTGGVSCTSISHAKVLEG